MTFEELEQTLPQGFHDAQLKSLSLDYVKKEIRIEIDFVVGVNLKSHSMEFRSAEVLVAEFDFCVMDIPDSSYPYQKKHSLWIDAVSGQPEDSEVALPPHSRSHFLFSIWVDEWNGYMRIAAGDMNLKWLDGNGGAT